MFDHELGEVGNRTEIEMGSAQECAFEQQEKHIQAAVFDNQHIPVKPIVREGQQQAGLVPNTLTETFNITDVQPNHLYDPTVCDYEFLDNQEHDDGYVDEDQFDSLMTILDLMFPFKYHMITVDVGGNSFQ